ncbi:MAG TPA: hypothetical protein VNN79_04060 [Actinomycetota bacterium]|nr:hypothetical protein [Actinomycetota bacterium]
MSDEFDPFEERLHDMLQERGSQPVATPQAPQDVLRRTRRRQVSTALVSGVTAVAVIGGAILGVQAFGRGSEQPRVGATGTSDSTRTVTLDGYTITYPYDWALQRATSGVVYVNPGGPMIPAIDPTDGVTGVSGPSGTTAGVAITEPAVSGPSSVTGTSGVTGPTGPSTPTAPTGPTGPGGGWAAYGGPGGQYLQLSNQYPDHVLDLTCDGADFPSNGVALQVSYRQTSDPSSDQAFGDGTACPDGSTVYSASHAGQDGGRAAFVAAARVGLAATDADRQALFAAYDSIDFPQAPAGVYMGGGVTGSTGSAGAAEGGVPKALPPHAVDSVSTVVAGGTTPSGASWVMLTDRPGSSTKVEVGNMGFGWAAASAPGQEPSEPDLDASVQGFAAGTPPIVLGSVVGAAAHVEVRPAGGDAVNIPLLAAPAVTGIDRSYFLTELPDLASPKGTVVALDVDGNVIATVDYGLAGGGGIEPVPPACPTPQGGANDDPTCVPVPGCPSLAPGDKGAIKECIVCREVVAGSDGSTTESTHCPPCPPAAAEGGVNIACPAPGPITCPEASPPTDSGPTVCGGGSSGSGGGFVCPDNAMCATPLPAPACTTTPNSVTCSATAVPATAPVTTKP